MQTIRAKYKNRTHCPWLRKFPNACDSLPEYDGIEPDKVGKTCPHNVYVNQSEVFANRDGVMDSVDRILRLVNSADAGVLSEESLDPLMVTELLSAKLELDRMQNEKQKREYEKSRLEAQANQRRDLPSWDK